MKKTLFYTFISIFIATAAITLWGLVNKTLIDPEYLDKLFYLLIAEIIAPVIALFQKTNFFSRDPTDNHSKANTKINVVMIPKDSFPRNSDPHSCTITIYNQDTDEEKSITSVPKRTNGYLTMYLDSLSEQEMIKVRIENTSQEYWESEYFSPSIAKAELEKI